MSKFLLVAAMLVTVTAFSQGKTLARVMLVKPKIGQAGAFEAAWKAHVAKFHNGDDKRWVYEIISGDYSGYYQFVEAPISYADMDKEKTGSAAHDMDFEKMVAPKLEVEMGPNIYSRRDSLGFNNTIQADKAVTTITHIKSNKMGEYLQEVSRGVKASISTNPPVGITRYVQMFSGTQPSVVTIRTLKDGFKELEANYFNRPQNEFRDAYVKMYGQEMWDKRTKFFEEATEKSEVFLTKFRKDLSSK